MSDRVMAAGKAVVGGAIAASAIVGVVKLAQRFPTKTKAAAVAMQAAAAVVVGGGLAAAGMPAAGTIVASTFAGTAIGTAMAPSMAPPVNGLIGHGGGAMRGLASADDYEQAMRQRRAADDQIRGIVQRVR